MKNNFVIILLLLISVSKCMANRQGNLYDNSILSSNEFVACLLDTGEVYHLGDKNPPSKDDINLFIKNRDQKSYSNLLVKFQDADVYWESLLYMLVAANQFKINNANIEIINCVSDGLSNPYITEHSRAIGLYYLNKWKYKDSKFYNRVCRVFNNSSSHSTAINVPNINSKSSDILKIKANCLNGSIDAYCELKAHLYWSPMYGILLYYAFIMADRYYYSPAKFDIIDIINRFYRENELGEPDEGIKYFCDFFLSKDQHQWKWE